MLLFLQELVASYISVLRRVMISAALALLLFVCVRHRDPLQQSLQVLKQLQETQRSLQVALQHAGKAQRSACLNPHGISNVKTEIKS